MFVCYDRGKIRKEAANHLPQTKSLALSSSGKTWICSQRTPHRLSHAKLEFTITMLSKQLRSLCSLKHQLIYLGVFLCILTLSYHQTIHIRSHQSASNDLNAPEFVPVFLNATLPRQQTRILKATMLYGQTNFLYEDALDSHRFHNQLHGYQMQVLRSPIVRNFQNKLLWLQRLISEELQKREEERAHWIMLRSSSPYPQTQSWLTLSSSAGIPILLLSF